MTEVAQNYASALFSLAVDDHKVIDYQKEAKELKKIIKDNQDFMLLLDSRFLSIEERMNNAEKILKGFSPDVVNFIKIIIKHNRVYELVDILEAFNSLCNESQDIVEGLIYSAFPLEERTLLNIKKKISEIENHEVDLITRLPDGPPRHRPHQGGQAPPAGARRRHRRRSRPRPHLPEIVKIIMYLCALF